MESDKTTNYASPLSLWHLLRCPSCSCQEWTVQIGTEGFPKELRLTCGACGTRIDKYWVSEDWRDLEKLGTFYTEKPKASPKSAAKEQRTKGWLEKHGY